MCLSLSQTHRYFVAGSYGKTPLSSSTRNLKRTTLRASRFRFFLFLRRGDGKYGRMVIIFGYTPVVGGAGSGEVGGEADLEGEECDVPGER